MASWVRHVDRCPEIPLAPSAGRIWRLWASADLIHLTCASGFRVPCIRICWRWICLAHWWPPRPRASCRHPWALLLLGSVCPLVPATAAGFLRQCPRPYANGLLVRTTRPQRQRDCCGRPLAPTPMGLVRKQPEPLHWDLSWHTCANCCNQLHNLSLRLAAAQSVRQLTLWHTPKQAVSPHISRGVHKQIGVCSPA